MLLENNLPAFISVNTLRFLYKLQISERFHRIIIDEFGLWAYVVSYEWICFLGNVPME